MPEPVPVLSGATVEEMETKQILLHTLKETESTAGLPRKWGPEKRDEEAQDEVSLACKKMIWTWFVLYNNDCVSG